MPILKRNWLFFSLLFVIFMNIGKSTRMLIGFTLFMTPLVISLFPKTAVLFRFKLKTAPTPASANRGLNVCFWLSGCAMIPASPKRYVLIDNHFIFGNLANRFENSSSALTDSPEVPLKYASVVSFCCIPIGAFVNPRRLSPPPN